MSVHGLYLCSHHSGRKAKATLSSQSERNVLAILQREMKMLLAEVPNMLCKEEKEIQDRGRNSHAGKDDIVNTEIRNYMVKTSEEHG